MEKLFEKRCVYYKYKVFTSFGCRIFTSRALTLTLRCGGGVGRKQENKEDKQRVFNFREKHTKAYATK